GGRIHGQDPERLQPLVTIPGKTDHASAAQRGLETVATKTGDMQEHIAGIGVIGQDEAKAFGYVKPFYRAGNLDRIGRIFIAVAHPPGVVGSCKPSCGRGFILHSSCLPKVRWTDSVAMKIALLLPCLARPGHPFSTVPGYTAAQQYGCI